MFQRKNRRLDWVYMAIWMDAIVFKVRHEGKVIEKAVQIAVRLNDSGYKDVLGMWICQNESAAFWMRVLRTLKSPGVEDILITGIYNLKGLLKLLIGIPGG